MLPTFELKYTIYHLFQAGFSVELYTNMVVWKMHMLLLVTASNGNAHTKPCVFEQRNSQLLAAVDALRVISHYSHILYMLWQQHQQAEPRILFII